MMTSFFEYRGPLLVNFLERGATINAKRYADMLQKLRSVKVKTPWNAVGQNHPFA